MSGAFPLAPAPNNVSLGVVSPTLVSVAHSLKRQTRSRGAHRYLVEAQWTKLTRANHAILRAFCLKQRGQYETFTWVLPKWSMPRGAQGGTPLVNGTPAAGARTVGVDGASNGITGWGKQGDLFKFAGHAKVYELTEDCNSDGGGNVTLVFEPGLFAAPANNEALTFAGVAMTLGLTQDSIASVLRPGGIVDEISLSMVEAP